MIVGDLMNQVPPLRTELVDVPEFGKDAQVAIQEFDAISASAFNAAIAMNKDNAVSGGAVFYACLIVACAINDKGEKIMPCKKQSDLFDNATVLASRWPFDLILRVGGVASELNGFTRKAVEEEKKPSPSSRQKQSSGESSRKRNGRSLKLNDGR